MELMSVLDAPVDELTVAGVPHRVTWLSGRVGRPGDSQEAAVAEARRRLGTGPQVYYAETLSPGAVTDVHFHEVDQFQVFVEGRQRLGRHTLEPVSVHYADAHTPYGPIVGDDTGSHYLTFRALYDPGARPMPGSRSLRRWTAGRSFRAALRPPGEATDEVVWSTLFDDEHDGLHCAAVSVPPGGSATLPAPCGGGVGGVVIDGALAMGERSHPRLTCIYCSTGEGPSTLRAGDSGVTMILFRFPDVGGERPNTGLPEGAGVRSEV